MKKILYLLLLCLAVTYCTNIRTVKKQQNHSAQSEFSGAMIQPDSNTTYAESEFIRGITAFELKNYHKALDLLTKAYIIEPDKAGVNYALSDTYLRINDLVNAAYYGKQAVVLDPNNKWYHIKLAQIYAQSGDNQSATDQLKEALNIDPQDLNILYQLASLQTADGKFNDSNRIYDHLLKIIGPDPSLYYQKYQNYQSLGQRDSMLIMLKKIHMILPDDVGVIHSLSHFYLKNHQIQEAKTTLQKGLYKHPEDPELLILMSNIYFQKSQLDSVKALLEPIMINPRVPPENKVIISNYLIKRNLAMPAEKVHKMVHHLLLDFLVTSPDYAPAHAVFSDYYMSTGETKKALGELDVASKLAPKNATIWMELIRLNFTLGKYKNTILKGIEANRHLPHNAFVHFAVGASYYYTKTPKKAIIWLNKASQLPSKKDFRSLVYGLLGDSFSSLKNWAPADSAYEKALVENPDNDSVLNNYAYFLSQRNKKLHYAEKMAERALNLDPGNTSYLDTMGWIYYKLGKYRKARKYLMKAYQSGNAGATIMEHIGDVYQKLGDHKQARQWWQKALNKDPKRSYLKNKINSN